MAVLFVLGILSITLAVSYAMLHSQTIDIAIHRNVKRTADARHAALTGLSIALRKLHEPDWKGVESRVVGELYANARYEVSFVTGDENLSPEDPRFNEYPFRLTVTSVGVAVDPTDPTVHVSHTVKAVVQLIRRAYSEPASGWDEYKKYGLYQWGPTAGQYQPPFQVAGDVFAAAPLQVCRQHPAGSDSLRSFDGRIDEVALFDRALTELEVVALHQGAAAGELDRVFSVTAPHRRWPFDESSSARFVDPDTGGPTGWLDGATAGAAGVEGTSLRFDGANDLADLGSAPLPATGMSAVCWVNPSENQSRGARLLQHANGPGYAQTEWGLGVTIASDRSVQLWAGVQTAAAAYLTAVSPTPIAADKWTAIAVVYNGNKLQIYQNGKLTASRSSATGGMVRRTGSVLTVGGNPPGSPRADYLIGLGGQVADGQLDYRPFLGDVFTRLDQQPALDLGLLQRDLRVRVAELPSVPQPTTPLAVGEYQLYPGGKRWPIEVLRSSISDQQLTADPRTNPLGLFQAKTTIVLGDKVRLSGSIVTQESRDVYIWGKHLEITPPELPALVDETARRRLPAIYGGDEVRVGADASGSIRGVVAAHGRLRVTSREADRQLLIDGPVICQQVEIAASQDFQRASSWWRERHAEYFAKRRRLDERWFPAWLQAGHDVSPKPTLTVRHNRKTNPLGGEVHWQDWSKPIYAPAAEDNGALRWELIEWRDAVELQENRS